MRKAWPLALWFERFVETIRTRTALLSVLMLLNLWGITFGFWFYRRQLPDTAWYYLPLVPDSPMAVILVSFALLAWRLAGKRWDGFDALAAAANVKIGAWTVFVLLFHRDFYFALTGSRLVTQYLLLIGHTGMVLEALVLLPRLARSLATRRARRAVVVWALPLALFLLNDYVDYSFDQHPPIPRQGIDVVEQVSYGLTFASVLAGVAMAWVAQRLLAVQRKATA